VLPLAVVVYVLTAPSTLVVDVYIEPELSVLVKTTGMTPVKPFEAVDTEVTVEGEPESVAVLHIVTGYARVMMEPA